MHKIYLLLILLNNVYVIAVYDVDEKRVGKVHDTMKKYLNWMQRSVFEGKITKSKLLELIQELKLIIDRNKDFVHFYILASEKSIIEEIDLGIEKEDMEVI